MKTRLLLLFLVLSLATSGQFAPVGTRWHYTHIGGSYMLNLDPLFFPHQYQFLEVEKDTLVHGKTYSKITGNTSYTEGAKLLRNDSGKVYYYWHGRDCFLMDFNAKAGDTLLLDVFVRGRKAGAIGHDTNFFALHNKTVIVDSISYLQNAISDEKLKTVHFHYSIDSSEVPFLVKPNPFNSRFTEKIISDEQNQVKFFIGIPVNVIFHSADVCTLRCFTSGNYKFSSVWWQINWGEKYGATCDDQSITTGIEHHNETQSEFSVYPNPAKDYIMLNTSKEHTLVSIFSSEGKLLKEVVYKQAGSHQLQLDFAKGIFLLKIVTPISTTYQKIVIQ